MLDDEQLLWYFKKKRDQGADMLREFPSTIDEAFKASVEGAYYTEQFQRIDEDGRICELPIIDNLPVHTCWDLGTRESDQMAIWWFQIVGPWRHFLDFYQNFGYGLGHYADKLEEKQRARGFRYGTHLWPHDGNARVLDESGRRKAEIMTGLGYSPQTVDRCQDRMIGINEVRTMLGMCKFDERYCHEGIKGLRNYRSAWDYKNGVPRLAPLHNKASNPADAFRTQAEAGDFEYKRVMRAPFSAQTGRLLS